MQPLLLQVLHANEAHKVVLDQYANKLDVELQAVNKFIADVENLTEESITEDPGDRWCLQAAGAFKPASVLDLSKTLDERSPFYYETGRRLRYVASVTPKPFSVSETKYLERAIKKENRRIAALRAQESGQNAFEAILHSEESFLENVEGIDWASVARDVSAWNTPIGGRTAQECKVRWIGFQQPNINTEPWTDEEEKRLREIVELRRESCSKLDWEEIAKLLETDRTPLDCIKRYQVTNRPTFRWTSPVDKKLMDAVKKYGSGNWVLVASAVSPEVSGNQCQIRYERTLKPEIKRGKFTAEEDQLLLKAIEVHGSDWVKVAQAVPGRTNAQCRGRYTIYLTGGIIKAPWEPEEDMKLRAAVNKFGHKWDKVRDEMGGTRHQTQYATRYRILMRWDAQDKETRDRTESVSVPSMPPEPSIDTTDTALGPAGSVEPEIAVPDLSTSTNSDPAVNRGRVSDSVSVETPAALAAKGTGAKRGRKRKLPDPTHESNTSDQSGSSSQRKRPRLRPRPDYATPTNVDLVDISPEVTEDHNPSKVGNSASLGNDGHIPHNDSPPGNVSSTDGQGEEQREDQADLEESPVEAKTKMANSIREKRASKAPGAQTVRTPLTRRMTRSSAKTMEQVGKESFTDGQQN